MARSAGDERPPAGKTTVYLLDDHPAVRVAVRRVLEAEPDILVVGETGLAAEAERRIRALRPHVAIVDCGLPDASGIEVCRRIRSPDPSLAVLLLTSLDDEEALFAATMAGAAGYVLKQVRDNELVPAVRRAATGEALIVPAVRGRVLERLRATEGAGAVSRRLTSREDQILGLLGEGLTDRQIAGQLDLAERTVRNHVGSLLVKLRA